MRCRASVGLRAVFVFQVHRVHSKYSNLTKRRVGLTLDERVVAMAEFSTTMPACRVVGRRCALLGTAFDTRTRGSRKCQALTFPDRFRVEATDF